MRSRKALRWTTVLGLIGLTAGALVWLGPFAESQTRGTCSLADDFLQPDLPLELNHVQNGDIVKTLAMDKEVFVCRVDRDRDGVSDDDAAIAQLRDVETFIEIVENRVPVKGGPSVARTVDIGIQVAACTKDFESGEVDCRTSRNDDVGFNESPGSRPRIDLATCHPARDPSIQPRDPVEMGTVFLDSSLAKTAKVEKEVLDCTAGIVDMYLFTEILEHRQRLGRSRTTMRPYATEFLGILCVKENPQTELGSVDPDGCLQFRPTQ